MKNLFGRIAALSCMIAALFFAQSTSLFADVFVNNVLSPFTVIEVGPGYGYVGPRYYTGPGYYESDYYYDGPRYLSERSYYNRPGYYDRDHGPRGAYCWVSTDRDRGYGYWDRCRRPHYFP